MEHVGQVCYFLLEVLVTSVVRKRCVLRLNRAEGPRVAIRWAVAWRRGWVGDWLAAGNPCHSAVFLLVLLTKEGFTGTHVSPACRLSILAPFVSCLRYLDGSVSGSCSVWHFPLDFKVLNPEQGGSCCVSQCDFGKAYFVVRSSVLIPLLLPFNNNQHSPLFGIDALSCQLMGSREGEDEKVSGTDFTYLSWVNSDSLEYK